MLDATITLKVNMQKHSTPDVRQKMHDAGIVPIHLHVEWLHLTIYPVDQYRVSQRYILCAERTAHGCPSPSILVKAEELIDVFQLLFVQPSLPAEAYMQFVKLLKPMVLTLHGSGGPWRDYVRTNYPKYFQ